jgi:uncharacterized protein (DUF1800 family)
MASINPLQGTLGTRRAAHLLRRTTYQYTRAKVDDMANQTPADALSSLLTLYPRQLDQPIWDDPSTTDIENITWILPTGLPLPAQDFALRRFLIAWWINEARLDKGIGHKMTMFFHQYMISSITQTGTANFYDYLELLRWGGLGNFKKLAYKIITDNSMLKYLNNNENTKANPNENFAREYLELFTIGKGPQIGPGDYSNYTEDDIVQGAKVLTGYRVRNQRDQIDPETNIPKGVPLVTQHDTSNKTFSSHFQNKVINGGTTAPTMLQELQAYVDMIFAQPETAKNLCRRLYRYFVRRNINAEVETDIITPMANTLIANNFEIKPVLLQLLQSEHFYDEDDSNNKDEVIGGIIKSPMELVLQSLNFFNIQVPDPLTFPVQHYTTFYAQAVIQRMFGSADFPIFTPADVAGYPGFYEIPDLSRQWFTSSTIIARYKLPAMLLTGTRQIGGGPNASIAVKLDIAKWTRDSGVISDPSDAQTLVQELLQYMLPNEVDTDRFNYFYKQTFLNNLPPADWNYSWVAFISSGNDTEVKIPLQRLIEAIMYSQEYQTL